jgi:hypothetical protein
VQGRICNSLHQFSVTIFSALASFWVCHFDQAGVLLWLLANHSKMRKDLLALLALFASSASAASKLPNIVFILTGV